MKHRKINGFFGLGFGSERITTDNGVVTFVKVFAGRHIFTHTTKEKRKEDK